MGRIRNLFLVMLVLMIAGVSLGQVDTTVKVDRGMPKIGMKYTSLTNRLVNIFGLDTAAINGITARLVYIINSAAQDTSVSIDKGLPKVFGKRPAVTNKNTYIFGNDTMTAGQLTADFVYLLNPPEGVNTANSYTWTVPQYFSTLIADMVITNRVDSTTSIRLYDTSGSLYALFSADTSWIPNLTVGNLNSTTIINGSSVTTNSVVSDTFISNSPMILRPSTWGPVYLNTDSVIVQNKLISQYLALNTAGNFISRLAVGMTDSSGAFNIVRSDKNTNRSTLAQATDTSSFSFRFTPTGKPAFNITDNTGTSMFRVDSVGYAYVNGNIIMQNKTIQLYNGSSLTADFGGSSSGGFLEIRDGSGTAKAVILGYGDGYTSFAFTPKTNKLAAATLGTTSLYWSNAYINNMFMDGGYTYLVGNSSTDGSWRMSATSSGSMLIEARISGTWTAKQTLTF